MSLMTQGLFLKRQRELQLQLEWMSERGVTLAGYLVKYYGYYSDDEVRDIFAADSAKILQLADELAELYEKM